MFFCFFFFFQVSAKVSLACCRTSSALLFSVSIFSNFASIDHHVMQKLYRILLQFFYNKLSIPVSSSLVSYSPFLSSHIFFVFFEQITTLISGTFLINIKVNFLNFNQVFSNVTPCIFTFFRSWFILIRFYLKYFSPQVNVMFISPSHRS